MLFVWQLVMKFQELIQLFKLMEDKMDLEKSKIIVSIGVTEKNNLLTHAFYRYTPYLFVSSRGIITSKHTFADVGLALGSRLWLEAERVGIDFVSPDLVYNLGANFIEPYTLGSFFSEFSTAVLTRIGKESSIGSDELEIFDTAFRKGLNSTFVLYPIDLRLIEAGQKFMENL